MESFKPRPITRQRLIEKPQPTREDLIVAALRSVLNRKETPATRAALRILIRDAYREFRNDYFY